MEVLSRFLTAGQAKKVIAGVKSGEVDCVIGTHRLLSTDVRFADLGLIIIDEEQRFYLESRGVQPDVAERLVVLGFFDEVIGQLPSKQLADELRAQVSSKLKIGEPS